MRAVAAAALVAVGVSTATAEPAMVTLLCNGTVTKRGEAKAQPISMSVVVNFAAQTVQGFGRYPGGSGLGYPVKIVGMDDVVVRFWGESSEEVIAGDLNRVTGRIDAARMSHDANFDPVSVWEYSLKCRPTQRLF
jgi:hypothetical protein